MTDLELLNQVIADHARLHTDGRASVPASPDIKDPAISFFAQQLQPAHPSHSSPPSHQSEPTTLDI